MILKFDVLGSPFVGNYGLVSNKYLITLDELTERKLERMSGVLKVEVIGIRLLNCRIIRPFFAGNSNGIIVSKIVDDETVERLKKSLADLKIEVLNSKYTAVGNLISANDKGGVVSPLFNKKEVKLIEDVLDIEVIQVTVSRATYVGSLLKSNNKGGIVTPYIREDEMERVKEILRVEIRVGTVNSGLHYVSAGILVNDYGAIVGKSTDGVELMNVSQTFGVG